METPLSTSSTKHFCLVEYTGPYDITGRQRNGSLSSCLEMKSLKTAGGLGALKAPSPAASPSPLLLDCSEREQGNLPWFTIPPFCLEILLDFASLRRCATKKSYIAYHKKMESHFTFGFYKRTHSAITSFWETP